MEVWIFILINQSEFKGAKRKSALQSTLSELIVLTQWPRPVLRYLILEHKIAVLAAALRHGFCKLQISTWPSKDHLVDGLLHCMTHKSPGQVRCRFDRFWDHIGDASITKISNFSYGQQVIGERSSYNS